MSLYLKFMGDYTHQHLGLHAEIKGGLRSKPCGVYIFTNSWEITLVYTSFSPQNGGIYTSVQLSSDLFHRTFHVCNLGLHAISHRMAPELPRVSQFLFVNLPKICEEYLGLHAIFHKTSHGCKIDF